MIWKLISVVGIEEVYVAMGAAWMKCVLLLGVLESVLVTDGLAGESMCGSKVNGSMCGPSESLCGSKWGVLVWLFEIRSM